MHFANGDLYSGSWKNDLFHGKGKYFIQSQGQALQGEFCDGKKQGKFKLQHANGSLDIFKFENDMIVGHGVRWNAARDKTWLLTNARGADEWLLGQKINKKRIPIVEAVSIGYECETSEGPEEFLSTSVAMAIGPPQINGHPII